MTGDIRLIHGDCLQVLPTLGAGEVDAIVTDPPYGTAVERDGYGRRQIYDGKQHIKNDADLSMMEAMLALAPRVLSKNAWVALFCSPKKRFEAETICRAAGFVVHGEIVWDKLQPGLGGGLRYQHETILLCRHGNPAGRHGILSVIRANLAPGRRGAGHPHEKPISLMTELVRYCSRAGETILDPFAGSGSTAVACMKTGRRCVAVECDAKYIPIIERRTSAAETPLFGETLARA